MAIIHDRVELAKHLQMKKGRIESLVQLLYDNFTEYFQSGDLFVTGSILYEKMGLISSRNSWKDLDIVIAVGPNKDDIVNEMIDFFSGRTGCTVNLSDWENLCAGIRTPLGFIDMFRDEDVSSYSFELIEIIDGVFSADYGVERILNVLVRFYHIFDSDTYEINHSRKQQKKFRDTLLEMYFNVIAQNLDIDDELRNEIREIIK